MTLIERLEALTGPCMETDSLIAKHLSPELDWVAFEKNGVDIWWSRCPHDSCAFDGPKPYTGSLDAAMTLVPEWWTWVLTNDGGGEVELIPPMDCNDPKFETCAATPAIALCIAALKARQ